MIDVDKLEITVAHPLKLAAGGHPLALDDANKRVFIGCRKAPKMVVMDSETGKEITAIDIPGEVDDLYYDAKRKQLYASCGEGYLAIIKQKDADTYEVVKKIETAKRRRRRCSIRKPIVFSWPCRGSPARRHRR